MCSEGHRRGWKTWGRNPRFSAQIVCGRACPSVGDSLSCPRPPAVPATSLHRGRGVADEIRSPVCFLGWWASLGGGRPAHGSEPHACSRVLIAERGVCVTPFCARLRPGRVPQGSAAGCWFGRCPPEGALAAHRVCSLWPSPPPFRPGRGGDARGRHSSSWNPGAESGPLGCL